MAKYLVGIDCGHGMKTGGKRTPLLTQNLYIDGKLVRAKGKCIHENEFNRAVGEYLADALERCGIDTYFTADRTGEVDTPLSTRSKRANAKGCDILVSLHYNAYGGCSSFLNEDKYKGGLLVLRTKICSNDSIRLGKLIANQLNEDIDYKYSYGLRRDVDISGFTLAILRQTDMPSVLIEYGFMDIWREAKLMLDPKHQKKCAESTCKAICEYFGVKYVSEKKKEEFKPYVVKVVCDSLNGREGVGTQNEIIQKLEKGVAVTIVEEKVLDSGAKWGRTKMNYWVNLGSKYVEFVKYV